MQPCPNCQGKSPIPHWVLPVEKRKGRILFRCRHCGALLALPERKPCWRTDRAEIVKQAAMVLLVIAAILLLVKGSGRFWFPAPILLLAVSLFSLHAQHRRREQAELLLEKRPEELSRLERKWYGFSCRANRVVLLLFVVGMLFLAFCPWLSRLLVTWEFAGLDRRGIPTTPAALEQYHRKLLPDDTGYPAFRRAAELLKPAPEEFPLDLVRLLQNGISPESRPLLLRHLAANRPALRELEPALHSRSIRFPRDWAEGAGMELPELSPLRNFANLYLIAGLAALEANDVADAQNAVESLSRLRDWALDDPLLLSSLVSFRIEEQQRLLLKELLRRDRLPGSRLEPLRRELTRLEERSAVAIREAFRVDTVLLVFSLDAGFREEQLEPAPQASVTHWDLYRYLVREPQWETRLTAPYRSSADSAEAEIPVRKKNIIGYLESTLARFRLKYNANRRDRIALLLAIDWKRGELPAEMPLDPVSGKPFRIETGPEGFRLRSGSGELLFSLPAAKKV